jgi:hypothetical protein
MSNPPKRMILYVGDRPGKENPPWGETYNEQRRHAKAWANQLKRVYATLWGVLPAGLLIHAESRSIGTGYDTEVAVVADASCMDNAYAMVANLPTKWDDAALQELGACTQNGGEQ